MGNKSKMAGATSKNYGVSLRNNRNGGSFGGNRWRGFEIIAEVHSRHPKGKRSYVKMMVPLKVISHGVVNRREGRALDGANL